MTLMIIPVRDSETAGLVSGYQITNITTAGMSAVVDTGGHLRVGTTMVPYPQPLLPEESLATQMQQDVNFRHLVQRGLADLQRGRYTKVQEVKRRLGDI